MADASDLRRSRRGPSSWRVRAADSIAAVLIALGGWGTIIAVLGVCVFLVYVTVPLFFSASIGAPQVVEIVPPAGAPRLVRIGMDEYLRMGWSFHADGTIRTFRADTGKLLEERRLFEASPTAAAFTQKREDAAFGFADGRVILGRIGFEAGYLEPADAPQEIRDLPEGELRSFKQGVVERTPEGQLRTLRLKVELDDPILLAPGRAVELLDLSIRQEGPIMAALTADGFLRIRRVYRRKNLITRKVTVALTGGELALGLTERPERLLLTGVADSVMLIHPDGRLDRYDARKIEEPRLVETADLTEGNLGIGAIEYLIGKTTILCGDSGGGVSGWFMIKPEGATTLDGGVLVEAKRLDPGGGGAAPPVTAISASTRSRMTAVGSADGTIRLYYVTSGRMLAEGRTPGGAPVEAIALAPKDDMLFAAVPGGMVAWSIDAPHPEIAVPAIFSPVWYEGYVKPEHVWQSSSGVDDFEPKYGTMPLIFGTLKATFYSMLFAVPLALLAAIYTSEFLHPRVRVKIKPGIEMMASLPSVVLGFLAALVIAPFVEDVVPQLLSVLIAAPFALLLGGHLWQMLSRRLRGVLRPYRLPLAGAALLIGVALGWIVGPLVEAMLWGGNIMAWLDGQVGTGAGAWFLLFLPLSALATALIVTRVVNPRLEPRWAGGMALVKFLAASAVAAGFALLLSVLVDAAGWDPRGTFADTYVQRNALVVGLIMGFAVIPIIYTIAEDALSAVPEHLRAGSFALGATPWQTGVRVIVPTAMSGIFSAVMIGLGRAVGETMIVLMAAGNTPVLEWNVFNGFRTLSANIAVELPEAVQNSTHYRMLFLSALVLFTMTFVVNTIAETVRLRFRRRAYEL